MASGANTKLFSGETFMEKKTSLHQSPITPNKGAAGVKVGATTKTVQKQWGEPLFTEQITEGSVLWKYQYVSFWFKSNKVDQIGVRRGYEGKTKEGIGIGSAREEVEKVYGYLEWDGTWLINVPPPFGIGFDFGPKMVNEPVTDIFVFKE